MPTFRGAVAADRVVAVVAELQTGEEQVGSGYLLRGHRVLTAWHCTVDNRSHAEVKQLSVVRLSDGARTSVVRGPKSEELDVAVLDLADADPAVWPRMLPALWIGRVNRSETGELTDCVAVGFPRWQKSLVRSHQGVAEVRGNIRATEGRESQKLVLRDAVLTDVGSVPATELSESVWAGLSGAVVFHRGLALGVVIEHHLRQGPAALQLRPLAELAHGRSAEERELADALDLGAYERLPSLPRVRDADPLRAPYLDPATTEHRPLRLLRAEYQLVPFQSRDELTVLLDWCRQIRNGHSLGLVVITGLGGSGKTRLALELADRLLQEDWHAGVLPTKPENVEALSDVYAPLLIVLDYADGRVQDFERLLPVLRRRQGPPAVLVLTARSSGGQWLQEMRSALDETGLLFIEEAVTLPATHPRPGDIYQHTVLKLGPARQDSELAPQPPPVRPADRWTTLDLVLFGWVVAKGIADVPQSRGELYDNVLEHESKYQVMVYEDLGRGRPDRQLLLTAAAVLTLTSPSEDRAYDLLAAVTELNSNEDERLAVFRTLRVCLAPEFTEGLALRPDPIGDHLVLKAFTRTPPLLERVLGRAHDSELANAVNCLARAGQNDFTMSVALITALLEADPDRWPAVLAAAAVNGGSPAQALVDLTERADCPLPLDDLSYQIPLTSLGLYQLGFDIDRRRLELARQRGDDAELASLLHRYSARADAVGDRAGALASITEAVSIRRRRAEANPAFLPNLATALNNLSVQQSDSGDRAGALASITEAVTHYHELAEANPAAFLPNLAGSLNNLSVQQSDNGDRAGALASITEAVTHYRQLAEANPAAFLPDLATALNNLSNRQSDNGNRAGALASITEAVSIRRQLAEANPAAFLSDLAMSLNNLSVQQGETGDRAGALASITEAVSIRRQLVEANPAVFLPDLAGSLNNLSNQQSGNGDRAGALASITEAVTHYRQLAEANPAAFLPNLAGSLNNLSNQQSGNGDRAGALASITEAVTHYRQLAEANPAAFLPDLAGSLNNLSNQQSDTGDRAGALASITEAVTHYHQLAEANPAAFLSDLAMSLNNMSVRQSDSGDRTGALASITEAVSIRRQLAEANPAAFLPNLANALNNLSNRQSGDGDRTGALASITEAVSIRRQLAETNPAAFLPDLAGSLNNLSNRQSDTGDRAGALASITEAVTHYRQLAEANPAVFLPDLATALNNMSVQQGDTGDRTGALATITEAVSIRRQLAEANPAVFLPNLATALNNLSNQQNDTGDRAGALASITEAVTHYRQLAETNPAAFLPDLAGSLNNLSVRQSDTGDRAGALATIIEAVNHHRQLAETNPAAFLPDLAGSLNNLSVRQSETGDRAGALASITEAVSIRRQLTEANPAVFLPDLAGSLNNLSVQQSETGDRAGALASITEAVSIRRQLAEANPAAFLADLATSLRVFTNQLGEDPGAEAHGHWIAAIETMPTPLARAALRAAYARQLKDAGNLSVARTQLQSAVREAEEAEQRYNAAELELLGRTRRQIRQLAEGGNIDDIGLPNWVTQPIADSHTSLIEHMLTAMQWPECRAIVEANVDIVASGELGTSVSTLSALYPNQQRLHGLALLFDEFARDGYEAVVDRLQVEHDNFSVLSAWINTATWEESEIYLRQHLSQLTQEGCLRLLNRFPADIAIYHAALAQLAVQSGVATAYQLRGDSSKARDAALDAVEQGDTERLELVVSITQLEGRLIDLFLYSVLAVVNHQQEDGEAAAREYRQHAQPIERQAQAIRLRQLRRHRPEIAGIDELITILTEEPSS